MHPRPVAIAGAGAQFGMPGAHPPHAAMAMPMPARPQGMAGLLPAQPQVQYMGMVQAGMPGVVARPAMPQPQVQHMGMVPAGMPGAVARPAMPGAMQQVVIIAAMPPGEPDPFASWVPPSTLRGRPENGSRTYQLKRKLGSGACGVVYEYTDLTNNKSVALKFPSRDSADDERGAFLVSQQINPEKSYDRHLSPAYEILEVPQSPGGMAQVWGWGGEQTLAKAIGNSEFWKELQNPLPALKSLCCQMLSGLQCLHNARHIHGDLHMENVMFHKTKSGRILANFIDFGLCMPMESKGRQSYFGDTARFRAAPQKPGCGPAFGYFQHPPELWLARMLVEPRPGAAAVDLKWSGFPVAGSHDVWSVGVMFYYMFFVFNRRLRPLDQLVNEMIRSIQSSGGACETARALLHSATSQLAEPAFKNLLDSMLEPDPGRRKSATELLSIAKQR